MHLLDTFYPAEMTSAAGRLDTYAADLRARAAALASSGATCTWDGAGARSFRNRSHETTAQLVRAAELLGGAARLLRAHGDAVAVALTTRPPR